jgi:hypothetical protein
VSSPPPYQRPTYEVARHGARTAAVPPDSDVGPDDEPVAPEIRRRALVVRAVIAVLALVAIGVAALLGGFDQVADSSSTTVPAAAVDEEINTGPWLITIESAQIGHRLREYGPPDDGDLVLQINTKITVVDDHTRPILDAISLDPTTRGVKDQESTTRYLHDNTLALEAQPGLPVRVAYLWIIAKGTAVPRAVTVVVHGYTRRYMNFRFLGKTIEKESPQATVTVPLLDRTATT